jgi:hypothetical protein
LEPVEHEERWVAVLAAGRLGDVAEGATGVGDVPGVSFSSEEQLVEKRSSIEALTS